jgi:peptidoglycan/LPS O-acetylase OafA/YrhL
MLIRPRLYLLDTLRGLASLSVVVWHYQHFFYVDAGIMAADFVASAQPYYSVLKPFYHYGTEAVQLFFAISGFIFFLTCYSAITTRKMTAWRFAALRFSRLYPLHFLTLLLVAAAQYLSFRIDGRYIVYEFNDGWHFVTQLFLASHWGWQAGHSFNGPIWSVSVEMVLYAMFFCLSHYLGPLIRMTAIAALAMFCLSNGLRWFPAAAAFTVPAACFFAGGISYAIWDAARLSDKRLRWAIMVVSAAASVVSIWLYPVLENGSQQLYFVAYPASILFLAMLQDEFPTLGRRAHVIGDITYATYLIHFPLQLGILLAAKHFGFIIDFYAPTTFLLFFSTVVLVSIPIYHLFELPMQHLCRRQLLGDSPTLTSRDDAPAFCRRRSWISRPAVERRQSGTNA